jgi:SAM-dependent methyltransferase
MVRRFASRLVDAAGDLPILDVACGSGRHAVLLLRLGCTVICVDRDLAALEARQVRLSRTLFSRVSGQLVLQRLDLIRDPWPFGPRTVGGILNIHFFAPKLFPFFARSLSPGGYLLFETVPGCGGNYLELPKAGEVRNALGKAFDFEFYKEGRVGPRAYDAVTVQTLARRR